MNKIKFYILKYKYIIIASFLLIIFLIPIIINNKDTEIVKQETKKSSMEVISEKVIDFTDSIKPPDNNQNMIKVDIKGAILNPGVYQLEENSRVVDVITMAGGLSDNANTDNINLSKKIKDEMVIYISTNDEVLNENELVKIEYECKCDNNEIENEVDDNLISINKASKEELMTLNGIGASKADAIIKYREEKGKFENIEDIMNVSGIGESAYSKIKDYIKL